MLRSVYLLWLLLIAAPCRAAVNSLDSCNTAVALAERTAHIPVRLLDSISRIESGRRSDDNSLRAWPWTINAEGRGYFYDTKEEAIMAARDFQSRGIMSIDVGCMQVNLHHHPDAFSSLEEAFDPRSNANYGARFLTELFDKFHAWPAATAAYHSQTPGLGDDYARKVLALWNTSDIQSAPTFSPAIPAVQPHFTLRPAPTYQMAFSPPARIIRHNFGPVASGLGNTIPTGRTLAAYRAMPVRLAMRPT